MREQFEAMGGDERACWGEFVRRVEGRPPGKAGGGGGGGTSKSGNGSAGGGGGGVNLSVGGGDVNGEMQVPQQQHQVMAYHGPAGTLLQGMNGQSVVQEDGSGKPVMDSLQSPIASQGLFFFLLFFHEPMSDLPCDTQAPVRRIRLVRLRCRVVCQSCCFD